MIDFDNAVIMNENFLEELNIAIDKTIKEKKHLHLDYNSLEDICRDILKAIPYRRKSHIETVVPIKKEEILKIVLDFFKSIDEEFYRKAVTIILQADDKIKMNIYNYHKIKEFGKKNENGVYEYTPDGSVQTKKGEARINIPMRAQLRENEEKVLEKDTGTLDDLYTIIHEISHTFDLDIEKTAVKKEEIIGEKTEWKSTLTRELLGESTAVAFELLLTEYLTKKKLFSEEAIREYVNSRTESSINDARIVYAKLLLAREKEKNGKITLENIETLMRDNNMTIQGIRRLARYIIDDPRDMLFEKRYAIAGLVAPTIVKEYNDNPKKGTDILKRYLKEAKEDNLEDVLKTLKIKPNKKGINKLIKNMKNQDEKINQPEGR